MKKGIMKVLALALAICAILPALPAMAQISRDATQQLNARKDEPVNPIEARKDAPVNPIEARKDAPANPID